jgi:four helix bundle protein
MENRKTKFVNQLQARTKHLALESVTIFRRLPRNEEARIIGKQFLRSALSIGANYRAVCRARSRAELFSKLSITVEETDEVLYWLEILIESELVNSDNVSSFTKEAKEILAILATARKNAR